MVRDTGAVLLVHVLCSSRALFMHIYKRITKERNLKPGSKILDLGGGDGRVTAPFTEDHEVTVVDKKALADSEKFNVVVSDIAEYVIEGTYDVIVAKNVLPFLTDKKIIREVIDRAMSHLSENGIFIFSLFGERHEWTDREHIVFHTKEEVEEIISGYNVYYKEESEGTVTTMKGGKAYWHAYEFWLIK